MIGERKVNIPSYIVTIEEEDSVRFTPESKIPEMLEKTKKEEPKVEATEEETTEAPATEAPKDKSSSTE